MASAQVLKTDMTELLRIRHPVLLAGMDSVSTAKVAAAVSNAGGLGSIGGGRMTPKHLRNEIKELKEMLHDKTAFGVDLLLPQVGGKARKTNHDYTGGNLAELIEIIATSGTRLFISAVGVPPKWVVERLHKGGVLCMNMAGHPRHVEKAIEVGMDIVCCQGYDAGGHTGEVGTAALIPMCLDAVKGKTSAFTGKPIQVVAAGGIYDDRSMAAMLAMGAQAVWVGTRFVACEEATSTKHHREGIIKAGPTDTIRTLIYTGRPVRTLKTPFVMDWETKRQEEIQELTSKGVVPYVKQLEDARRNGEPFSFAKTYMLPTGQAAGMIDSVLTAKQIVDSMTHGAARILQERAARIVLPAARL
eukprot:TRINITY_DN1619_c0_g1_i2.p2 TRINITY_DN1619_c0_g1~~TRINITY_DN1619_c0_g1_i2.p2  ORF type:complete len:378 (+),score=153.42 TRINITY_DN1619_c0_g1_i2:60-1136(+)